MSAELDLGFEKLLKLDMAGRATTDCLGVVVPPQEGQTIAAGRAAPEGTAKCPVADGYECYRNIGDALACLEAFDCEKHSKNC